MTALVEGHVEMPLRHNHRVGSVFTDSEANVDHTIGTNVCRIKRQDLNL